MNYLNGGTISQFFLSFEIKLDVTSIDFTTKKNIFTPFWYQDCKISAYTDMIEMLQKSPNVYCVTDFFGRLGNYSADCRLKIIRGLI